MGCISLAFIWWCMFMVAKMALLINDNHIPLWRFLILFFIQALNQSSSEFSIIKILLIDILFNTPELKIKKQ